MTVVQQEKHNYTTEQVREHVLEAIGMVQELDPPEDLRVEAFKAAVNMLSAKRIEVVDTGSALGLVGRMPVPN